MSVSHITRSLGDDGLFGQEYYALIHSSIRQPSCSGLSTSSYSSLAGCRPPCSFGSWRASIILSCALPHLVSIVSRRVLHSCSNRRIIIIGAPLLHCSWKGVLTDIDRQRKIEEKGQVYTVFQTAQVLATLRLGIIARYKVSIRRMSRACGRRKSSQIWPGRPIKILLGRAVNEEGTVVLRHKMWSQIPLRRNIVVTTHQKRQRL